jgi:hypothetical protein
LKKNLIGYLIALDEQGLVSDSEFVDEDSDDDVMPDEAGYTAKAELVKRAKAKK